MRLPPVINHKIALLVLLASVATLVGCRSSVLGIKPPPYLIRQGNVIDITKFAELKPGMTHDQVIFLTGVPLMPNLYDSDKWDYLSFYELPGDILVRRHVVVHFKDDLFTHWAEQLPVIAGGSEDGEDYVDPAQDSLSGGASTSEESADEDAEDAGDGDAEQTQVPTTES